MRRWSGLTKEELEAMFGQNGPVRLSVFKDPGQRQTMKDWSRKVGIYRLLECGGETLYVGKVVTGGRLNQGFYARMMNHVGLRDASATLRDNMANLRFGGDQLKSHEYIIRNVSAQFLVLESPQEASDLERRALAVLKPPFNRRKPG